jgi:hypothetical protein
VIRAYDGAGNVIETHEHKGASKTRERYVPEAKSRHAVMRDGLLRSKAASVG